MTLERLFNDKPLEIGGFVFRARSADTREGSPATLAGWQAAMQFASAAEESAPYWIGDLLAYAEDRADWREKIDQAKTVTHLAHQTLLNYTTLARKVKGRARDLAPSPAHARVVTTLEPDDQEDWLEQAGEEGWTVREFDKRVRAGTRRTVLEGQAETLHTVDVTVRIVCEAQTAFAAEQAAWAVIKTAVNTIEHTHVIAAHAVPHVGRKGRSHVHDDSSTRHVDRGRRVGRANGEAHAAH